ncbi:MAG: hypothetical protein JRC77_07145, partial [Deltaproteobacteria bacterium]|nr:hypothetical protein [Deltaproteobacteria bacterium]
MTTSSSPLLLTSYRWARQQWSRLRSWAGFAFLSLFLALPASAAEMPHTIGIVDGVGNVPDGVLVYMGDSPGNYSEEIDLGDVPLGDRDARWIELSLDDQVDHHVAVATYIDSSAGRLVSELSTPHLFSAVVAPPPVTPPVETEGYFEDFESYTLGSNPTGWMATGPSNSLIEDSSVFGVMQMSDGNFVYGVSNSQTNIHSHYAVDGSEGWQNYEFGGFLATSLSDSGIGITLYSDYPNSDSYYRLRSYSGKTFQISSHGSSSPQCEGIRDTGVDPQASVWYQFRFRASSEASGTHLQAKVWAYGSAEPGQWQVDCTDPEATLQGGRAGLWAMGPGEKVWDDLYIVSNDGPLPDTTPPAPEPSDIDEDGVADDDDNCIDIYNPDQSDDDDNGLGNACDPPEKPLYSEDFSEYVDGQNPFGWFDTNKGNSMDEADWRFMAMELEDGDMVLGTESTGRNIHSHYLADNSANWTDYEFSGQLAQTDLTGGVGVTLFSDFPNSNAYYRLRTYRGKSFRLSAHGDGKSDCPKKRLNTGVKPSADTWYNFRIQAFEEGLGSRVRAKVWEDGSAEPAAWQANCLYTTAPLRGGSPGVWSWESGSKFWDNLVVKPIE